MAWTVEINDNALKQLEKPEPFISIRKQFCLPDGVAIREESSAGRCLCIGQAG